MNCFRTGFRSVFEYKLPPPWGHVKNYPVLLTTNGQTRFRNAMAEQVRAGKMLGGPGWTAAKIRRFFGGRGFYGIPSGAVPKGDNPLGRIVHDYGYYKRGSYSINAAHSNTSVTYMKTQERIRLLEHVE